MRSLWIVALLLLVACAPGAPAASPLTGDSINAALNASGLPISDVQVYTAESDPNNLLGRPDQYTGKVSWHDTRARPVIDNIPESTLEIFSDTASLKARKDYTEAISKTGGAFAKYIYVNEARRVLLRLPHELTPDQAKQYEAWLAKL